MIFTNKQINKKLDTFTYLFAIQIFLIIGILFCSHYIYYTVKEISSVLEIKKYSFFEYIYHNGQSSYIYKAIKQVGQGKDRFNYLKELIYHFLNELEIEHHSHEHDHASEHEKIDFDSVSFQFLSRNFYIFNFYLQLSIFLIVLLSTITIINFFVLFGLFLIVLNTKNTYQLKKLLIVLFFNIFGIIWISKREKEILKTNPEMIFKTSKFLENLWLFKFFEKIKSQFVNFEITNTPAVTIKKLYFSYELKHNNFKHFWDIYKWAKRSQKYDEKNHLFSIKNLFNKNKKINYVLKDINLEIPKNSFTVIVGPNSCGKSTLVKCIVNLQENYYGEIFWHSNKINKINKKSLAQNVVYIPQELNIPKGLNIHDFLLLTRIPFQKRDSDIEQHDKLAVLNALKKSGCYKFSDKKIDEISGGQKQKVILASILTRNANAIVLDEPNTFFDIKNQINFLNSLEKMNKEGKTIITILHDLQQALNYATHLIIMKEGQIYKQGNPIEVLNEEVLKEVFKIKADLNIVNNKLIIENISAI